MKAAPLMSGGSAVPPGVMKRPCEAVPPVLAWAGGAECDSCPSVGKAVDAVPPHPAPQQQRRDANYVISLEAGSAGPDAVAQNPIAPTLLTDAEAPSPARAKPRGCTRLCERGHCLPVACSEVEPSGAGALEAPAAELVPVLAADCTVDALGRHAARDPSCTDVHCLGGLVDMVSGTVCVWP